MVISQSASGTTTGKEIRGGMSSIQINADGDKASGVLAIYKTYGFILVVWTPISTQETSQLLINFYCNMVSNWY